MGIAHIYCEFIISIGTSHHCFLPCYPIPSPLFNLKKSSLPNSIPPLLSLDCIQNFIVYCFERKCSSNITSPSLQIRMTISSSIPPIHWVYLLVRSFPFFKLWSQNLSTFNCIQHAFAVGFSFNGLTMNNQIPISLSMFATRIKFMNNFDKSLNSKS